LTVEKLQHRAEATVSLNGTKIHADSVAGDMYAAVDGLIDKLVRRVRKHKEKLTDRNTRVAGRTHLGDSG
jgi:putative sigma-54 modulation protein